VEVPTGGDRGSRRGGMPRNRRQPVTRAEFGRRIGRTAARWIRWNSGADS